jgi:hypothetical protein
VTCFGKHWPKAAKRNLAPRDAGSDAMRLVVDAVGSPSSGDSNDVWWKTLALQDFEERKTALLASSPLNANALAPRRIDERNCRHRVFTQRFSAFRVLVVRFNTPQANPNKFSRRSVKRLASLERSRYEHLRYTRLHHSGDRPG